MPTKASMKAAGMTEEQIEQAKSKYVCYVCGEPLSGLAQKDMPRIQDEEVDGKIIRPAPPGTVLGPRHRECKASEHAGSTKKVMLAWRSGQQI